MVKISKVKTPKVASKTTVKPPVTQRRDSTPNRKRGTVAEAKTPAPLTVPWVRNPTNLRIGKGWGKGNLMMWLESLIQLIHFKRVGWMIMDKIASGKKDWNWHGEKQFFLESHGRNGSFAHCYISQIARRAVCCLVAWLLYWLVLEDLRSFLFSWITRTNCYGLSFAVDGSWCDFSESICEASQLKAI